MIENEEGFGHARSTILTCELMKIKKAEGFKGNLEDEKDKITWEKLNQKCAIHNQQDQFLHLLKKAIKSAQISIDHYDYYRTNKTKMGNFGIEQYDLDLIFYYSENYIAAMKRIYERLSNFNNSKLKFPESIADTVKLVWKKKKSTLEKYIEPRNFIEHQAERLRKDEDGFSQLNNIFFDDYHGSEKSEHQVKISRAEFKSILEGQNEIFQSTINYANAINLEDYI